VCERVGGMVVVAARLSLRAWRPHPARLPPPSHTTPPPKIHLVRLAVEDGLACLVRLAVEDGLTRLFSGLN
jgi:hypothetical protein